MVWFEAACARLAKGTANGAGSTDYVGLRTRKKTVRVELTAAPNSLGALSPRLRALVRIEVTSPNAKRGGISPPALRVKRFHRIVGKQKYHHYTCLLTANVVACGQHAQVLRCHAAVLALVTAAQRPELRLPRSPESERLDPHARTRGTVRDTVAQRCRLRGSPAAVCTTTGAVPVPLPKGTMYGCRATSPSGTAT